MAFTLNGTGVAYAAVKFNNGLSAGTAVCTAPIISGAPTEFSVSFWATLTSPTALTVMCGQIGAFWIGHNASGNVIAAYGNAAEKSLTSTTSISDGNPHFIELCVGPSGGKLFVDGALVASNASSLASSSPIYSNNTSLRAFSDGTFTTTAKIDDVAFYSVALHSTAYTAPTSATSPLASSLLALFALDNSLADSAGGVPAKSANDAGIFYSPYNWRVDSTSAITVNPGAYLRTIFSGTSCELKFNMTGVSSPVPNIAISVDGRTLQVVPISGSVTVTMPSGQSNTKHLLEVVIDSTSETLNRWDGTPAARVELTGMTLSSGSEVLSLPAVRDKKLLVFGDSIAEGVRTLNSTSPNDTDRNSAIVCWPLALARSLNAEVGVVGFGASGISVAGNGGVPKLPNSYAFLWSGQARSFSPAPDYCVWLEGANDGASSTVTDGLVALNGMLTAMLTTKFILFRPLGGNQAANLQQIATTCSDPSRVVYRDTTGFFQTANSSDTLHPYGFEHLSSVAPKMVNAISAAFPSSSSTASYIGFGGVCLTGSGQLALTLA